MMRSHKIRIPYAEQQKIFADINSGRDREYALVLLKARKRYQNMMFDLSGRLSDIDRQLAAMKKNKTRKWQADRVSSADVKIKKIFDAPEKKIKNEVKINGKCSRNRKMYEVPQAGEDTGRKGSHKRKNEIPRGNMSKMFDEGISHTGEKVGSVKKRALKRRR